MRFELLRGNKMELDKLGCLVKDVFSRTLEIQHRRVISDITFITELVYWSNHMGPPLQWEIRLLKALSKEMVNG